MRTPFARFPSPVLALLAVTACGGQGGGALAGPGPAGSGGLQSGVYSEVQATQGENVFVAYCSGCHSSFDLLSLGFPSRWAGRSLSQLYDVVKNAMPENDPGILTPEQAADVIAYMLSRQGFPAGAERLPADPGVLAGITIEPAAGD
jgi:mono/diheme cytochrome c family protein